MYVVDVARPTWVYGPALAEARSTETPVKPVALLLLQVSLT
jgi:hypothetical protein